MQLSSTVVAKCLYTFEKKTRSHQVYQEANKKLLQQLFYSEWWLDWLDCTLSSSNLSFGIGSKPRQCSISAQLSHLGIELVSQDNSEGHTLLGLISGISKHQTLCEVQSQISAWTEQKIASQFPLPPHFWLQSPGSGSNTSINVWTLRPGHQLPRPPLFDPGERPEQCQGTAAPKPPAHCRSYSQSL